VAVSAVRAVTIWMKENLSYCLTINTARFQVGDAPRHSHHHTAAPILQPDRTIKNLRIKN
jgi:hypothetical protein